ncbi:hypothetical protein [Streptomyces sp. NPDC048192]|uniref:hypothetical protein n=1 Tax=unclassified Streptomyces TaxID=2593676 RepID=UPI0037233C63
MEEGGRLAPPSRSSFRILPAPVVLDDGLTVDFAVSVGAVTPHTFGSRDLAVLQRAAGAALSYGKHSDCVTVASPAHTTAPSINGLRAGRPGIVK